MKLVVASNNSHKIREIRQIAGEHFSQIMSLDEVGIVIDVVEDGDTFEANAAKKAMEVAALIPDMAVLADDSGLEVNALNGAPGVYSARFAGEGHDDKANNEKLLRLLTGVPCGERGCRFVASIALARPGKALLTVTGTCSGVVGREPVGEGGFGYDPLFVLPSFGKTFAQLTAEEKNQVSHRARALALLQARLMEER